MRRYRFAAFLTVAVVTLILVACGRNERDESEPPEPPIPFTQMQLALEDSDRSAISLLTWQTLYDVPKEGHTLRPTVFGANGVDIASAFVLTLPEALPAGRLPAILIDGQPQPIVTRQSDGSYLVTPAVSLAHNALVIFRMARSGDENDITWAFQTMPRFEVVSTLPGNQSVNVPVNTGIEINFSVGGYEDIREYFSIEPHVNGRFIRREASSIFMPTNPLEQGKVYTVNLRAGFGLAGTGETLAEDHIFSFETNVNEALRQTPTESFHFFNMYTELPSFEPPQVNYRVSYPWGGTRPTVDIGVYRIDDEAQAVEAVREQFNIPRWSVFAWRNSFVDVSRLTRVASMTVTQAQGDRWFETLQLPNALPAGFYVINAVIGGEVSDQMILQITDIAVQIVADDDMTILWANDMVSGQPVNGARVSDGDRTWHTDGDGIAIIPNGIPDTAQTLVISAPDGKRCILFTAGHINHWGWWGWHSPQPDNAYWSVLQLDRTIFQRNDTVYFWGFAQNRSQNEAITHVTAVLTEGWGFGRFGTRDTLHRQTVAVQGGAYSGEMRLPNLDTGSYRLTVYHGDIVLGSTFFEVQDYVKPPYQMLVSTSKRAAFVGESVTFTVRTEFFEGTPVPELGISYGLWGHALNHNRQGQGVTDLNGEAEITISQLSHQTAHQGETSLFFTAEATLPEIGRTTRSASLRVFINDIDVRARATRNGENAELTVDVNTITLDRINDGTAAHWGDYLDRPVSGQRLEVAISRVYWVPVRIGERYCFIERIVVPQYRHDRREEIIDRFTMTTGADGVASRSFTVPNRKNESYFARITTTDSHGRGITHDAFIGRDFWEFFMRMEMGEPFLNGGKEWNEGYDIGEEVRLTVMQGSEAVTRGNVLFVVASNGILEYRVRRNEIAFPFGEEHLPNATVYAFHFNGHIYSSNWWMRETLRFNRESRQLQIDVTTDQDTYKPGETANLTINVTDSLGNPVQADINISVVDEALFALQEMHVDTLWALFRHIPSGVRHTIATHRTFASDGHDDGSNMRAVALSGAGDSAAATPAPSLAAAESAMDAGSANGDARIRELFEDTAVFASLQTNARGQAAFSFRLPDNITSWRLSVSGITNNLYAGNDTTNIIVTQPMFLHYSLNSIFLTGDVPVLGVNAFGTSLNGGEEVLFEVWHDDIYPVRAAVIRAEGTAFERVNIPLWEMTAEGSYSIIMRATTSNGYTDTVRHNFTVVDSHRMVDTVVFCEVTADTVFAAGRPGLTQITFTDRGRGQYLHELMGMRWTRGVRLEGLVMQREANRLIRRYFPELDLHTAETPFDPRNYQRPDGGIAMLPYADSDLAVTVRMIPFIRDEVNTAALRNYLYNIADGAAPGNRILALYGLALLKEPVLLYLYDYTMVADLTIVNAAYLALGFASLGETHMARTIYNERITPHIQRIEPYYRVNAGNTRAEILEATSIAALLALQLNMPEREGLHRYTLSHFTANLLVDIQRISYIINEIESASELPASITYTLFGEEFTRDLSFGRNYTLRIPAQNLHEFNLTSVTGEVGAVSIHRVPLEEIEPADNDIRITRQYFRSGENIPRTTFNQGDLVRVEITVDYSRRDLTGSYIITDFLPAGLVYTPGSARFEMNRSSERRWAHATTEGQRITFYDHNSRFNNTRTYFYYARLINPGTFRAEGLIVQSYGARDYLTVGSDDVITIT